MASLSDSEKVSILRLTVLFAVDFNVHTSSETPLTESASGWGCFLPCSENHLMSLLKDDWCIGDYQHGLLCVLSYYKDIVLRYSISPSPGSDVITQAQLVSACTHFVFVCAISLGAHGLDLRFANKHAMPLLRGRETEYRPESHSHL